MPIKVPNNLPAVETLTKENIFVMTDTRAMTQDIRPLKILILNLMPTKIDTETQLTRLLGNTPLQVELELLQTSTHKATNTSEDHMIAFYKTFEEVRENYYDGMVITGAPVELMDFEEVEYWDELCTIMEWSKKHVHNTFHICWGAQAGLYYHYGIDKHRLRKKLSGIYAHRLDYQNSMLFRGFDDRFYAPHSRNTEVRRADIESVPELEILSSSEEAGIFAVKSKNDRQIFIMGHSEYDGDTLLKEYLRDKEAGASPEIPKNYFPDDDYTKPPMVTWRSCANLLYSNWLNYFVYQSTPYEIQRISENPAYKYLPLGADVICAKFGGSSLADAKQFAKVKEIVKGDDGRRYVVVSALGKRFDGDSKITDLLGALADNQSDEEEKKALLREVEQRYRNIASELLDGKPCFAAVNKIIEDTTAQLAKTFNQEDCSNVDKEYILSRGEFLTALLLANYLDCRWVDSKDIIKFRQDSSLDKETTKALILQTLTSEDQCPVVIPGFYGSDCCGKIRTFSRGGSDITGALVAASMGADLYENWTDVTGLLMADPQIVKKPKTIPVITFKELRELAYMGAPVMHQDAIMPVSKLGIPINIKNTNAPTEEGTLIVKNSEYYRTGDLVAGITGELGYISVMIEREGLNEDPHKRTEILEKLTAAGIHVANILAEIDSVTLIMKEKQFYNYPDIISLIERSVEAKQSELKVTVDEDLSIIAVVGRNMGNTPEVAVKVLNALSAKRINVKLIDHSPQKMNMLIGVAKKDYEKSINAIYNNTVGH